MSFPKIGTASGRITLVLAVVSLHPALTYARIVALGPPVQANSTPASVFGGGQLVALPDGGFVVTWGPPQVAPTSPFPAFGRRFDAAGNAVGADFTLQDVDNLLTAAAATDGTLVLNWGPWGGAFFGRFTDTGLRLGDIKQGIPEQDSSLGDYSAVAATHEGGFVAIWDEFYGVIRGQRFDAADQPTGPPFVVSPSGGSPSLIAVSDTNDGGFVVAWVDYVSGVWLRGFDAANQALGEPVDVESAADGTELCVDTDGGSVVAWSWYDVATRRPFSFRRYNQQSEPTTPPFSAAITDLGAVACLSQGRFVVVGSTNVSSIGDAVVGRAFDADSHPIGEFVIPTSPFARQPSVARLSEDTFVVTWSRCTDAAYPCDIFAQRFTVEGNEECPGDCNGDGRVTIDELLTAVKAALDDDPEGACFWASRCPAIDTDLDCRVSVTEIIAAVNRALEGCV